MKNAIIIGGTLGIGEALSKVLLANNYKVVVTGIEKDVIEHLKKSNYNNLEVTYLDCIKDDISKTIIKIVDALGVLDVLVLSAGIGNLNNDLGFEGQNNANRLNVLGFTEIADWSYRFFEKQGYGHFVAITSISGVFGSYVAPAYHAAKAYQINYLAGLRQKAQRSQASILITDVRPGFVHTSMTAGKKMFWSSTKEKAGKQIFDLIKKKRTVGYITKRWRIIAILIKILPNWLLAIKFKK